jgi:hypothetical protein
MPALAATASGPASARSTRRGRIPDRLLATDLAMLWRHGRPSADVKDALSGGHAGEALP